MIGHYIHTQHAQQGVVTTGTPALEDSVLYPAATHTEHHLVAGAMGVDHLFDHASIILQVRIQRNDGITIGGEQARQQCILVAAVAREFHAIDVGMLRGELFDELPGAIRAAVIDEPQVAVIGDLAPALEIVQQQQYLAHALGQHRCFVVTGNDNAQPHVLLREKVQMRWAMKLLPRLTQVATSCAST